MKILVLGSNGFIGSNALQYFRKKYSETYGCDIVSPVVFDEKFFLLDKINPQFEKLFLQNTFDICINASGSGSVPYSIDHPDEDYDLNVRNVFFLLNSISRFNSQCRFINFSSAAVYGNPESLPVAEKSRTKPMSPYGFHKLISEQICAEFYHLKKIRTCSLRVFSAYGEGLRKQLFWDIYQKSRQSSVIELFGSGEETRDFIHIQDLLFAVECIIEQGAFAADVINVGSGVSTPVKTAAGIFLKALGNNFELKFNNLAKAGDPKRWLADIEKISALGFSPTINLQKGLSLYAEWILANHIKG